MKMTIKPTSTKKCLICKGGMKNDCLHWHESDDGGLPWVWCQGKCQRAYSMYEYTAQAGLSLGDFLKLDFDIKEAKPNEVTKMGWPRTFVPLFDAKAKKGIEYIKSRGLDVDDGMYYDIERKGIVFPYYFDNVFVGAQTRMLTPWTDEDGTLRKIDTLPGTRLGLLFYNWNQSPLLPSIKGIIITEGAFNALSIQQALNDVYGGLLQSPWKCIACSGAGASKHHIDTIKELKESGLKVIIAPDSDEAGIKMFKKFVDAGAATHYALTNDDEKDWNDFLKEMGKQEFAKWFLGKVKSVS